MRILMLPALILGAQALSMPLPRREVCRSAALVIGAAGLAGTSCIRAAGADQLGASKMLTIGQYLEDLREARNSLPRLQPLLENPSETSCKAFRVELRKAPFSGIRKACSKVILVLDEKSTLRSTKEQQYEDIKQSLGSIDDACRDGVDRSSLDLVGMLTTMGDRLQAFEKGFGIDVEQ
ncbi:hypothetical protein AB1Y20_000800 [Prymnesium parvum]|uniref:Pectinesterase inhibitor domain-containing protein n=1 Tax=Prymnesium parvum TaxID=97485 RepID=A0AB34KB49_PRYPA